MRGWDGGVFFDCGSSFIFSKVTKHERLRSSHKPLFFSSLCNICTEPFLSLFFLDIFVNPAYEAQKEDTDIAQGGLKLLYNQLFCHLLLPSPFTLPPVKKLDTECTFVLKRNSFSFPYYSKTPSRE